jgi:hypothetical protein
MIADTDIGGIPRAAGAVDDTCVRDQEVIRAVSGGSGCCR